MDWGISGTNSQLFFKIEGVIYDRESFVDGDVGINFNTFR